MASRLPFRSLVGAPVRAACFAVAACAFLAACGFHLRDALLLPEGAQAVRIASSNPDGPLERQLGMALARAGAKVAAANSPDAAGAAKLHIVSEQLGNTPISVDQYGRSQEYTLRYAVIFELRSADGADLVPQQAIELSRDYISVPTNSAGTDSERDLLLKELRRDMVSAILRRIDAVSRLQQAQGAAVPAQAPAPTPASTPTP
ncbi:MAG: LPS-assembly lipoprotein LptE [Luteimonas sp.]